MSLVYETFRNPPAAWRGKPFWAWNGQLDKEELLRQACVMKEMGFGGFYMHSRTGLATTYLGKEWFEDICACAKEAEALGMEPWIYDEDRWPSGPAGGIVTKDPRYRSRHLTLSISTVAPKEPEKALAVFCGRVDGVQLAPGYFRLKDPSQAVLPEGMVYLSFCVHTMRCQSAYNGYTDLDRLNAEATREFLRVTHEQYVKQCGKDYAILSGVFMDEPNHGSVFSNFSGDGGNSEDAFWSIPWTDDLAEEFFNRYGESLTDRLPELFLRLNGTPVAKIKWQYMELLQQLFIERFLQPIQNWCRQNNLILTGHFVNEDSLMSQTIPLGSMLRCYAYLDRPGMDCLTDNRNVYWAAKVLESAARQNGQFWKMSELYGATGWHMRFEDYKRVGDWHALLGINTRCPHLSYYTMQGESKRDYPGSFLHQATWWKEYERLETYFARLGFIASQGKTDACTLVLHPVESLWGMIYPHWANVLDAEDPIIQNIEKQFTDLFDWMMETGVDFDYGDEGVLEEKGKLVFRDGTPCLRVGNMLYTRIIVGGCLSIRKNTLLLLDLFEKAGGELLFVGDAPKYVGCEETNQCTQLSASARQIPFDRDSLLTYFEQVERPIVLADPEARKDFFLRIRHCDNEHFVILLNKGPQTWKQLPVSFPACYSRAERWDCFSGTKEQLPVRNHQVFLDFAPGQEQVVRFLNTGTNENTVTDTEADAYADAYTSANTAMDSNTAADADTNISTATNANTAPNADTSISTGTDTNTAPNADTNTDADTYAGTNADTNTDRISCSEVAEVAEVTEATNALRTYRLTDIVSYSLNEPNVLVLDKASLWVEGKQISEEDEILVLDRKLRDHLGIAHRGGEMLQPWALREQGSVEMPANITLQFAFSIRSIPEEPILLAIEPLQNMTFSVNETSCTLKNTGKFWVDTCYQVLEIPAELIKTGTNHLTVHASYTSVSGLESLFLLGSFGVFSVAGEMTIEALPDIIKTGDLTKQGFPFYSGKVNYDLEIPDNPEGRLLELELPSVGGSCALAEYGNDRQMIPWPWQHATWKYMPGCTRIRVEVVLNRRNTFGPLHHFPVEQPYVAPDSFVCDDLTQYALYPSGLLESPVLIMKA